MNANHSELSQLLAKAIIEEFKRETDWNGALIETVVNMTDLENEGLGELVARIAQEIKSRNF